MRQIEDEDVRLARHTPDHRTRLAEVRLPMALRVMQRHESLARRLPPGPHIVLHDADRVKTLGGGGFRPPHGDVRIRHETHSWH